VKTYLPRDGRQRRRDLAPEVQLLPQPERNRQTERRQPARRKGKVCFEQPLKLEQRLVVEDDVIEVPGRSPPARQQYTTAWTGKRGIVLLAAEALLLRGGNDAARRGRAPQRCRGRRRRAPECSCGAPRAPRTGAALYLFSYPFFRGVASAFWKEQSSGCETLQGGARHVAARPYARTCAAVLSPPSHPRRPEFSV